MEKEFKLFVWEGDGVWREIRMGAGRQLRQCDKCGRVESYSPLQNLLGLRG